MNKAKISTQPYKGMSDWLPDEFAIQKYIFDTWRKVCVSFGYKEYLTPLLEYTDLYLAKSGEVKEELFTLRDRADRELALRPEMTPSVTRLVASMYKGSPKPIRLFSIAPFYRNEAPQKGRSREFWQLNADIFGEPSLEADIEVLSLAIEIMLAFGAPKNSFKLYLNDKKLIEKLFSELNIENRSEIARIMDKFDKIGKNEIINLLKKENLNQDQIESILTYMSSGKISGEIKYVCDELCNLGYENYIEFKPNIIRGFEYYNGMIFEVFDTNPNNTRSLFGGGRYNGLSEIFGVENFPATGFAPGNVTLKTFLEDWNLVPNLKKEIYYFPKLTDNNIFNISNKLRNIGLNIETGLKKTSLSGALRKANKLGYGRMLIVGETEMKDGTITIKNLSTGEQITKSIATTVAEYGKR